MYGRMNSSTGWLFCSACCRVGEGRAGDLLELRELARRVDQVVVGAGCASRPAQVGDRRPRGVARAGAARAGTAPGRLVAGLDSSTSTSRSSSVERRLTNVVLARRSVVGSSASACASATFSAAIAAAVAFVLATRSARSSRRSATARDRARGVDEEVGQRALVLRSSWLTRRREVDSTGLKYSADSAASAPLPSYCAAKPWMTPWRSLRVGRVERVEQLVEVDDVGRRADGERRAVVELLRRVRRRRERDVAVGDARQRGQADHGLGALAQRRVRLLDLDADARAVVVGERDRADRADAAAADLHVVVLDELARVLEHEVVLVRRAPAQEQHGDEDDGEHQGGDGNALAIVIHHPRGRPTQTPTSIRPSSHVNPRFDARATARASAESYPGFVYFALHARSLCALSGRWRATPCRAGRARRRRGTGARTCCRS